jgi:hypothetical protein
MEKKCKHCKEKFKPVHFNQKFCFKEECKNVWLDQEKAKQWIKRKKEIKEELETVQTLMKKAQKVFNEYIRLRDKDKPCISCGNKLSGKYDAGHYFSSGGHKNVTFNEDNVHGQCVACNQHKHGNLLNYQVGIEKRIGGERLLHLHEIAHETRKFTRQELKDIIEEYKKKVKQLKK